MTRILLPWTIENLSTGVAVSLALLTLSATQGRALHETPFGSPRASHASVMDEAETIDETGPPVESAIYVSDRLPCHARRISPVFL